MDTNTTIQQIGNGNLMACGARDFLYDSAIKTLTFRVGSKHSLLEKVLVTLESNDTYTVRYVAMNANKRSASYLSVITDESQEMVYSDSLGGVVRKMGDRA